MPTYLNGISQNTYLINTVSLVKILEYVAYKPTAQSQYTKCLPYNLYNKCRYAFLFATVWASLSLNDVLNQGYGPYPCTASEITP